MIYHIFDKHPINTLQNPTIQDKVTHYREELQQIIEQFVINIVPVTDAKTILYITSDSAQKLKHAAETIAKGTQPSEVAHHAEAIAEQIQVS